jgi:hypothetical protein
MNVVGLSCEVQCVMGEGCDLRVALSGPDSWEQLPAKNKATWPLALARYPQADGFVKLDLDTYLVAENFFEALVLHEARAGALPDYMGSRYTFHLPGEPAPLTYCSGGAGYLVSRRAAEALTRCPHSHAYEDVLTGLCLRDAGIGPLHHTGFLGDDLSMAMLFWLRSPEWENHHPDTTIPAALISLHGYKDTFSFIGLDILLRAKTVGSRRYRLAAPGEQLPQEDDVLLDDRPAFDVCCRAE